MPDDQLVAGHIVTLGQLDGSIKPGMELPQMAKPTRIEMSPLDLAVRKVVQAITLRADELHLIRPTVRRRSPAMPSLRSTSAWPLRRR